MSEDKGSRLTVNLTPKGRRALENLTALEFGATQTDVVNRALDLANYMAEVEAGGGRVIIKENGRPDREIVFI